MKGYLRYLDYLIVSVLLAVVIIIIIKPYWRLNIAIVISMYACSVGILHVSSEWASKIIKNGNHNAVIVWIENLTRLNLWFKIIAMAIAVAVLPAIFGK
jgi:hypothetical protein